MTWTYLIFEIIVYEICKMLGRVAYQEITERRGQRLERVPCAECQAERDERGLDGIWCSSPDCYVLRKTSREKHGI